MPPPVPDSLVRQSHQVLLLRVRQSRRVLLLRVRQSHRVLLLRVRQSHRVLHLRVRQSHRVSESLVPQVRAERLKVRSLRQVPLSFPPSPL